MSNLLGTFISQSLCGHKNPLFIGSVNDARVPGGKFNVYSCPKCMKVFKSEKLLSEYEGYMTYQILKDNRMLFLTSIGREMDIQKFIENIKNGIVQFSRNDLKTILTDLEKTIKSKNELITTKVEGINSNNQFVDNEKNFAVSIEKNGKLKFNIAFGNENKFFDTESYIQGLKKGEIKLSERNFDFILKTLEYNLINSITAIENREKLFTEALKDIQQLEKLYHEEQTKNKFMQSVIDNKDNVIQSEETLLILNENEKQINNAGLMADWLTSLLLEKEVHIPLQAYKLFHLMLSTLYGYEPMRYRWEWEKKEVDGNKYYVFYNRKTRRTK